MNNARKIILSVWGPAVVIFPLSMVKVAGVWDTYYRLYQDPWFWYFCIIATGLFLMRFWGPKRVAQERKPQEGEGLGSEGTAIDGATEDMNTTVACSKCGNTVPRSKAIRVGEEAICLKCYL